MGNSYLDIKSNKKIAIIDCNNFYVSCERLFNPSLDEQATVVLSNNDGCIIARSQEVKSMGVKMGQPVFKLEDDKKQAITKFSSNYELYGDISDRIASILKRLVPNIETYSIDESFLDLSHVDTDNLQQEIVSIKNTIQKLTGIPVSIGVAPNKTLAKLCNLISKKNTEYNGTCSYFHIDKDMLHQFNVDEVWGIGRKYAQKLHNLNIVTVKDFINMQPQQVQSLLNIVGLRTWAELNEVLCHPVDNTFRKPQMITCSRSFGNTIWEPSQIKNAIWTFLHQAHKKLVNESLDTTKIYFFLTTDRFKDNYTVWEKEISLLEQTSDFQTMWNMVAQELNQIPNNIYAKGGVCLKNLKPQTIIQKSLFTEINDNADTPTVNKQYWQTKREHLSKAYTTNWDEIPFVF